MIKDLVVNLSARRRRTSPPTMRSRSPRHSARMSPASPSCYEPVIPDSRDGRHPHRPDRDPARREHQGGARPRSTASRPRPKRPACRRSRACSTPASPAPPTCSARSRGASTSRWSARRSPTRRGRGTDHRGRAVRFRPSGDRRPYIQKQGLKLDRIWCAGTAAARPRARSPTPCRCSTRAKAVEVVIVTERARQERRDRRRRHGEHLARHGVKVEVKRIADGDIDVQNAILAYAADSGADFIVMGGYGHSRLREFILGGVTRSILKSMTVPVLMSH